MPKKLNTVCSGGLTIHFKILEIKFYQSLRQE